MVITASYLECQLLLKGGHSHVADDMMHIETLATSKAGCRCAGLLEGPVGDWAAAEFRA